MTIPPMNHRGYLTNRQLEQLVHRKQEESGMTEPGGAAREPTEEAVRAFRDSVDNVESPGGSPPFSLGDTVIRDALRAAYAVDFGGSVAPPEIVKLAQQHLRIDRIERPDKTDWDDMIVGWEDFAAALRGASPGEEARPFDPKDWLDPEMTAAERRELLGEEARPQEDCRQWALANVERNGKDERRCGHEGLELNCAECCVELGRRSGHVEAGAYLTHEEAMAEIRASIGGASSSGSGVPQEDGQ